MTHEQLLALEVGQIDKPTQLLFSEDLWCVTYEGKHSYDEVKGYVLKDIKELA